MTAFKIYAPRCGEDGVIIVTDIETDFRVEFRGTPYSQWEEGEASDFCKIHDSFKRVDISRIHCGEVEVCTSWHGEEYITIHSAFWAAIHTVAE